MISHNFSVYFHIMTIASLFPCNYFVNKDFHFTDQSVSAFNIIKSISISKELNQLACFGMHRNSILPRICPIFFFGDLTRLFSAWQSKAVNIFAALIPSIFTTISFWVSWIHENSHPLFSKQLCWFLTKIENIVFFGSYFSLYIKRISYILLLYSISFDWIHHTHLNNNWNLFF